VSGLRLRRDALEWRDVDGELVALDVHGAEYLRSNRAGALIWRLLAEGSDRDALVAALAWKFGIDDRTAAADVDHFLGELRARGLLEE
jgi:hypothetical protein